MKFNTFEIAKKIITITIVLMAIVIVVLLILLLNTKQMKNVKEFVKDGTKVLYITNSEKYSKYPINLFEKYEIDYLYINIDESNGIEKSRLKKIVNGKYLYNMIAVFKNGKLLDYIVEYETEDNLNKFLQGLDIIPDVIGSIDGIVDSVPEMLESELSVLYFPYKFVDGIDNQNKILDEVCKENNIEYKMINAYLLSFSQQEKINSILQISSVKDQIVIFVKDGKIVNSIRGFKTKNEYLNKMYEIDFITQKEEEIDFIDYDGVKKIIKSNDKNILVIIKDNCKYCDYVIKYLSSISSKYNLDIKYININEIGSDISNLIEKELTSLGYNDGFTTPITLLIESGNLLDYVIGSSPEEYFVDIFKENGIIK